VDDPDGAAARRHRLTSVVFAPLLPAYWVMYWIATWRGLYQLISAPKERLCLRLSPYC
jgi:hypothetical protein